jgi:hypothetical protein
MTRPPDRSSHPSTTLHRRRFLELGAAATAVAVGGCLGFTDETEPYTEWIPAPEGGVPVGYLDFSIATETKDGDTVLPLILPTDTSESSEQVLTEVSGFDTIDDPLLTWPIEVGGRLVAGASIAVSVSGLGYLVDPEQPEDGIEELFMADSVVVGRGEIDLDEATKTLRSGSEGMSGDIPLEKTGTIDDFGLYEPTSDETLNGITAISERAVILADTREEIRRVIKTAQGNRTGASEEGSTFEWLVETAGEGHIVGGWVGPADLEDVFFGDPSDRPVGELLQPDDDVLGSATFNADDGTVTADFTAQRPLEDSTVEQFESQFGSESGDHSITIENDRVTASGVYSGDVLDFEITRPDQKTTVPPDASDPIDPPATVAQAVPDDAFEFSYESEQDRVRIGIVKKIDAEKVTFEAINAESKASTTTPKAGLYLYVFVDPGGDTVVVTVTVDGTSGVVARQEFP